MTTQVVSQQRPACGWADEPEAEPPRPEVAAASRAAVEAVKQRALADVAAIRHHLDAAATVERWLYCYPDWVAELGDPDRGLRAFQAREIPTAVRRVQRPTESEAIRLADIARKVTAINAALARLAEPLRVALENHYLVGTTVRRRKRTAALAELIAALLDDGILRGVDNRGGSCKSGGN